MLLVLVFRFGFFVAFGDAFDFVGCADNLGRLNLMMTVPVVFISIIAAELAHGLK